jgi:hypothetical protein
MNRDTFKVENFIVLTDITNSKFFLEEGFYTADPLAAQRFKTFDEAYLFSKEVNVQDMRYSVEVEHREEIRFLN